MSMGKEKRHAIFMRAGGVCYYCGVKTFKKGADQDFDQIRSPSAHKKKARIARRATIEHLKPRRNGGNNDFSNLTIACQYCNSRRGHMKIELFKRVIAFMVKNDVHPHQIYDKTGIWMTPEPIRENQIKNPTAKKETEACSKSMKPKESKPQSPPHSLADPDPEKLIQP